MARTKYTVWQAVWNSESKLLQHLLPHGIMPSCIHNEKEV